MKTNILLIFAIVGFSATQAWARIGETEAQIEARYGKPVETSDDPANKDKESGSDKLYKTALYKFSGMEIFIFINRSTKLSELEAFNKISAEPFSENEIALIMQANAAGKTWKLVEDFDFSKKQWWLSDGTICATSNSIEKTVTLYSKAMTAYLQKHKAETEAENLKGL